MFLDYWLVSMWAKVCVFSSIGEAERLVLHSASRWVEVCGFIEKEGRLLCLLCCCVGCNLSCFDGICGATAAGWCCGNPSIRQRIGSLWQAYVSLKSLVLVIFIRLFISPELYLQTCLWSELKGEVKVSGSQILAHAQKLLDITLSFINLWQGSNDFSHILWPHESPWFGGQSVWCAHEKNNNHWHACCHEICGHFMGLHSSPALTLNPAHKEIFVLLLVWSIIQMIRAYMTIKMFSTVTLITETTLHTHKVLSYKCSFSWTFECTSCCALWLGPGPPECSLHVFLFIFTLPGFFQHRAAWLILIYISESLY